MRIAALTGLALLAGLILPAPGADDKPANPRDQALAALAPFVGGVWTNIDPKFIVEFRYQWAFNKTAIRANGIIDKGGAHETTVEATFGWDPVKKCIYYLDMHGSSQIFFGTLQTKGNELQLDFETLVGPAAKWRSIGKLTNDTYDFAIYGRKDDQWVQHVKQTMKRKEGSAESGQR